MSDAVVYLVGWEDLIRYQSFLYDLPKTPHELRHFDGASKEDWWEPPPIYSEYPRREAPDFWHLFGVATILTSPTVVEELGGFFHPVGELLPMRATGTNETFLALNILRDVDCLNPDAYRIDDLEIYTDFIAHRLPESGLFKVPQVDNTTIFYLERSDDDETLREAIDARGYRGLRFDPVWSSEGSVVPINLLPSLREG
jgi:hypothetical protein